MRVMNIMDRDGLNEFVDAKLLDAHRSKLFFVDLHVERLAMWFGYDQFGQSKRLIGNLARDLRKAGYKTDNRKTFIRVHIV